LLTAIGFTALPSSFAKATPESLPVMSVRHRIELGLLGGDRLSTLRQQIFDPETAGVRILGVLGNEHQPRQHEVVIVVKAMPIDGSFFARVSAYEPSML
jgi:hypothetical protein